MRVLISSQYCPDFGRKCLLKNCVCFCDPDPMPLVAYCSKYAKIIQLEEKK